MKRHPLLKVGHLPISTVPVGPPPGLESNAAKTSEAIKSTVSTKQPVKVLAPKANRYETRFMLALSASPLVAPPEDMPALNQWYG